MLPWNFTHAAYVYLIVGFAWLVATPQRRCTTNSSHTKHMARCTPKRSHMADSAEVEQ